MANTTLTVNTSLDIIGRYIELVEALLGGASLHIRAKEALDQYTQKIEK